MKNWTVKKFLGFCALMVLVVVGAKQCGRILAEQQNARDASATEHNDPSGAQILGAEAFAESGQTSASPPSRPQIVALVSRQSNEGMTEEQLDSGFVERLGVWVNERTYTNAVKFQEANGGSPVQPMRPESVVVEAGGKRFGVVRIRQGGVTPAVTIVGLDGGDIVRIACVSRVSQDVPIGYGPCNDKVLEVFGTSISSAP